MDLKKYLYAPALALFCFSSLETLASDDYPYRVPPGYELVLDENFDNGFDESVWTPQTYGNGVGNAELQYYQPDNISVVDGFLDLEARPEVRFDQVGIIQHNFTSGRLSTIGKKAFRYGKIAIRANVPNLPGTHFAFWMGAFDLNVQGFPLAGNMDIVQTGIFGQFDEIESHFQFGDPETALLTSNRFYYSADDFNATDGFHIYEIEWTKNRVIFMVDGNVTGIVKRNKDNAAAFDTFYYLVVNLGIQGPNSIHGGLQTFDYSDLPKSAKVDWIKVWQRPGLSGVKTDYSSSEPITDIEGGNFILRADKTPAIYRYAFTEGQFLAFFTGNIGLANPIEEADPVYPTLPLQQALQPESFEGGSFMDFTISNSGQFFSGYGWYSEYGINLSAYENSKLVIYMKSEHVFSFFEFGMIDTSGTQVQVPLSEIGTFVSDGEWHRLEIPVSRFSEGGIDLTSLLYPLLVVTEEPPEGESFNYGLDNIHFEWETDDRLIFPSLVDTNLVFNFEFSEPKRFVGARLIIDGKETRPFLIKDAEETINADGSASYQWDSCLSFPAGTVVQAIVRGVGETIEYFPGEQGEFSPEFVVQNDGEFKGLNCKRRK